ncbi:hypothetical protein Tco_0412257 [Tanacetum coccineum]
MPAALREDSPDSYKSHQGNTIKEDADPEETHMEDDEEDPRRIQADYPCTDKRSRYLFTTHFVKAKETAYNSVLGYEVEESSALVLKLGKGGPSHSKEQDLCDVLYSEEAIEEEARLSRAAWARSMDACDQVHSEGISLRTTVMAQQSEITELQAADRRRQAVITDLLKADYRRQRQLVETLKIVKSLKAQMIELQRQQGPAKDPAEPELPEEASSSS